MSSLLFSPIAIGGLGLKNRIVIAPMCQYSADNGAVTDWHFMHYGSFSHSGAGLLIMEATSVTPEGRISPDDLGLWSDELEKKLGRLVEAIRKYSGIPLCLQLAHAGRKASQYAPWKGEGVIPQAQGGWLPEAPSPLRYEHGAAGGIVPRAMDKDDFVRVRKAFAQAAKRAANIGFDAVEVHAAHGYLLHECLSPLSNARQDEYGGSLENRMRYPLEVFGSVREAFPADKPVGVRISGSDWAQGGWSVEQSGIFSSLLRQQGCAYIHVSGGGLSAAQQVNPRPGYQADMAAQVRADLQKNAGAENAPTPVIAVGLITSPEQAENIVVSGQADMVALGRGMLYDPRWPWHAAQALGACVSVPPQYLRAAPYGAKGLFTQE